MKPGRRAPGIGAPQAYGATSGSVKRGQGGAGERRGRAARRSGDRSAVADSIADVIADVIAISGVSRWVMLTMRPSPPASKFNSRAGHQQHSMSTRDRGDGVSTAKEPPMRTTVVRTLVVLLLAGGAACTDLSGIDSIVPVSAVTFTTDSATIVVGEAHLLHAVARGADGEPLAGRPVTWSSESELVARVDAIGRVVGVAAGTTRIRATSGGRSAQAVVTVTAPARAVASVTLDAAAIVLAEGATRRLVATPRDADGEPIDRPGLTIRWTSDDGEVAGVSAAGVVTALHMGTATIAAVVEGRSVQARVTVHGTSPADLIFERWAESGGLMQPFLARLDLRVPGATPVSIPQLEPGWQATPSPDGTRLAFACDGPTICVADADGRNVIRLTDGTLLADQPAWSPDGALIAFRGWAQGGPPGPFNPSRIWVMRSDGTGKVKLTGSDGDAAWEASPAWSPTLPGGAQRIAYSRQSRSGGYAVAHIASILADGSDARPESVAGAHLDEEPSWSPDGLTIAFVRTGGEAAGDIWLARAGGGDERPLMAADPSGAQRSPAWSPDGSAIAFASDHEILGTFHAWQIYTLRADGSGLARRTHDSAEKQNPAWIRRMP